MHRTQSYNEMSARYIPLPNENYIPDANLVVVRASKAATTANKQAGKTVAKEPTLAEVLAWIDNHLIPAYDRAQQAYEKGLDIGIPKELARLPVPVARYSCMRASANLRNWIAFLTLRADSAAQWEIRQYANAIAELLKAEFPRTYDIAIKPLLSE